MHRVIYADVLVVINTYITYFLLKSAAVLAKEKPDSLRLFLSSLLGGLYSLCVLLPEKLQPFMAFLRLFAMVLFVLVAFGYRARGSFIRVNLCFLFSSFLYAGIMLALWYFISPGGMYFNGSVVYFDISILTLALLTVACYASLRFFEIFFKKRAPVNTVFYCSVCYEGAHFELKAFLDTGNRLTDYFTGRPVIVASRESFKEKFPEALPEDSSLTEGKIRRIFCNTLGGGGLLPAFSPEKVQIKGQDYSFVTSAVTVALTEKALLGGEYDAILPMGLFDDNFERKDEAADEQLGIGL